MRGNALRALSRRLHDESGIALIMALGIMFVLTLMLATVIVLTSASARHAQSSNAGQKAQALADAGLNNAVAQLSARYPHYGTPPEDPSWATSPTPVQYAGGTASWSGTYDAGTTTWSLTGVGTVKNPTGPDTADVVRTAKAKLQVSAGPPPFVQYGLFAGDPSAGCSDMGGGTIITVAVYVASTCGLTIRGGASIVEPTPLSGGARTVTVNIGGLLSVVGSGNKVGTPTQSVLSVRTRTGCNLSASCQPGSVSMVYAETYGLHKPFPIPRPNADEIYAKANWAAATCVTGTNPFDNDSARNQSLGTVSNLLTRASFDCTARDSAADFVGRLAWNLSTKQMVIDGMVFIDGDLITDPNHRMQYSGDGTIYVNGTVNHKGTICGPGSGFNPAASGSTPPCDPKVWDPANGQLLIIALNANGPLVNTPTLSFLDPNEDGVERNWDKTPTGSEAWQVLDDGARVATAPVNDRISSVSPSALQDLAFPDTLTYNPAATYTLRVYGSGGARRGVSTLISTDSGASFGSLATTIGAGAPAAWYAHPVTSLITSQAALNGFRARLRVESTGGGGATAAQVHAVYLEVSTPNWTRDLGSIVDCPVNPYCAFWVGSQAVLEAGSWAIGDFQSDGGSYVGGSVYTDRGNATILGSGNLKAFVNLPPGAPESTIYNLSDASEFG